MRIRWHGHACFEFSDGSTTIVIDPHDGRSLGLRAPSASADVVLMTHDHYDHNASRVIKGEHQDIKLLRGEAVVKNGIKVIGYPAWHDTSEGADRGPDTIYKFEMEGMSFCHVGDLGCIPSQDVIDAIKGMDFLFIPVGEVYTMEIPEVKKFIELVNPRIVVPMHYMVGGLSFRLSPLDDFLDIVPDDVLEFVGNEIEFSKNELPEEKLCWVFD